MPSFKTTLGLTLKRGAVRGRLSETPLLLQNQGYLRDSIFIVTHRFFLLLLFVVATSARADWHVGASESEIDAGERVEHRHVVANSDSGEQAILELALFSTRSATLRVIDNAEAKDDLAAAMQRENCIAGVNGGYFDPSFAPIGLRVLDGKTTRPLTRARLLTGVLSASAPRGVEIIRLGEFYRQRKLDAAIECGPFLVDLGLAVRGLDETRGARRTFVAVARGGKAALGSCSSVSLAQLAEILATPKLSESFTIWRAMNLDGGSSSAFWCRRSDGRAFSISEDKRVRDFLGVVAKP